MTTLLYTVVLVGVLVFVHELGHFTLAKVFKVRVMTFSLGFGPRLFGIRYGETDYRVSLLPIGGYVRMLGEQPEDELTRETAARAYSHQPAWKRMAIIAAGPTMNLLFPVLVFFVVHLGTSTLPPPVVGTVFPGRPAEGKLAPGDRILRIEGDEVATFHDVASRVADAPGETLRFEVEREGQTLTEEIRPAPTPRRHPLDLPGEVGRIGIIPHHPLPILGIPDPEGPAARAGLQTFDRVVAAGGHPIEGWRELEDVLEDNRGTLVPVTALRPRRVPNALGGLAELEVYDPLVAQLMPAPGAGSGVRRAGLEPAELYVSAVDPGSAAHRLGIVPGDRLLALDGRTVRLWATFLADLRAGDGTHELTWVHEGAIRRGTYQLTREAGESVHGELFERWVVGMRNWMPRRVDEGVPNPRPLRYALAEALESTWEGIEVTVWSVVRLVQGRLSLRTLGGPLAIYEFTGIAVEEGETLDFLTALAILSINLGLLNLLPVPLLDGGHLVFVLLEWLRQRPLSPRLSRYASVVGLTILVLLMVLALRNDLDRLGSGSGDWVVAE